MFEVSKFRATERPDGHNAELDRVLGTYMPRQLGKHAIGANFDAFRNWVDSGDPDFIHYITGEPAREAEIIPFPKREEPPKRAVAGN